MDAKKIAGIILLVVGIVILAISLFAYPLGLGGPAFGPKQIAGTVVGAIVIVVGLALTLKN